MAVDPLDFVDDLTVDGTDTLLDATQTNTNSDNDDVNNALVENGAGEFNQDVDVDGGEATSDDGAVNAGGTVQVGDDGSISGSTSASADAVAEAEAFTQDIQTGGNVQSNALNAEIIGSNRAVDTTGEDDVAGPEGPSTEDVLEGLATSDDSAGTDAEFDLTQSNDLEDVDVVDNALVTNSAGVDDFFDGGDPEFEQDVNADGGTASSDIGLEINGQPLLSDSSAGDDLSVSGATSASADAEASAEAFTQSINVGDNLQLNEITANVVGGNQNVVDTGEDNDDNVGLAGDNEDDTEIFFGTGTNTEDPALSQSNSLSDSEEGDAAILNPTVNNALDGDVEQTVTAAGGEADTDDGIDTEAAGDSIILDSSIGSDLDVSGSASASADAAASAVAFTQSIVSGDNAQQNTFDATVVSGSQNIASVGGDNAGSAEGNSGSTIADEDTFVEPEDTEVSALVTQSNEMSDNDEITNARVTNGDIPDANFNDGADVVQTVEATGGDADAEDGIDADGLSDDALRVDVGNDASVAGSSSTSADATAEATAFTQDLNSGDNVQVNAFDLDVVGGSQSTFDVGEDDSEDPAALISDDGDTETTVGLTQTNTLGDEDVISTPSVFNDAGSTVTQEVTAEGGDANSDDGITLAGSGDSLFSTNTGDMIVGDDLDISGDSDASADATAAAVAFTQNIDTGDNAQQNSMNVSVVGASQTTTTVAGDNAESSLLGAGAGVDANAGTDDNNGDTNTTVEAVQSNDLEDSDEIDSAEVINDYDPGFFIFPDGAGEVTQTVTATGSEAPGDGPSGEADGIDASGLDGAIFDGSIGDDGSISGSASATADATASATAFTQDIVTGDNLQTNAASISVIGGNEIAVDTGEDDAESIDATTTADAATGTSVADLDQTNTAVDADVVTDAIVVNEEDAELTQDVEAFGGSDSEVANGIALGETGEVALVGTVGDDLDISGSASASADAAASAEAFTQEITTGDNTQLNTASVSVIGGSSNTFNAGGDDAGNADDIDTGGDGLFGNGTDTDVALNQENVLDDNDELLNPTVLAEGGSEVDQDGFAVGGTATSGDGIGGAGGGSNGDSSIISGGSVDDDASISGSTSASADASVSLEAFTQDVTTGGNTQFNIASVSIAGGNNASAATGEDDIGTGGLDIAGDPDLGGTDSVLNISQSNGGTFEEGYANDADLIDNALVANDSGGAGGNGLNQNAIANGEGSGTATAGSGIATGGNLLDVDIGDDGDIDGAAAASAEAAAATEGFTQDLTSGENRQGNSVEATVVGANTNTNATGGDDVGGGDDVAVVGFTGDADSEFDIDQSNMLNDQDSILDPTVTTDDNGDTTQIATSFGGDATSGNGIEALGASGSGEVGDDLAINGETIASADATSSSEAFTQDISTGGNVQTNATDLSVVGLNDNLFFTGEDDGDDATDLMPSSEALSPIDIGDPDGEAGADGDGTDTSFEITQVNALVDNDMVVDPTVNTVGFGTDTIQNVSADGGTAMSGDGAAAGATGFFGDYSVLDDLSIEGVSQASADAYGAAEAFTQNIVVGANVQVNSIDVSVVGGSSTVNTVGEDDLA
ncbi:MAG: hypothetical protein AAGF54_02135 [Pseudomonadota bacterium]